MKKIVLLLSIFTLIFTSCGNNDDETPAPTPDQFIGTWKYFKYIENGVEDVLEPCETEFTLVILENGNFIERYFEADINNVCFLDDTDSGTWSNVGEGFYALNFDGDVVTLPITFENNTFYFEETYNNGTETITSRDVFIRVN